MSISFQTDAANSSRQKDTLHPMTKLKKPTEPIELICTRT
jgi:hypothetical protein